MDFEAFNKVSAIVLIYDLLIAWNNLWGDQSQGIVISQIESWRISWLIKHMKWWEVIILSQRSKNKPWNNLWTDLSQGVVISEFEHWNNLWADLPGQGRLYSQIGLVLEALIGPRSKLGHILFLMYFNMSFDFVETRDR